jgi:uncharacterized surface protein with fasciclin (FAS1) repeats
VIPPGTNFELLKTGASGGLEQIGGIPTNLPNQKKVTFVLLEEQDDGTLKVQGVKGSGKDKPEVDVDSILKRIKNGEIKLPPNLKPSPTVETKLESTTPKKEVVAGITVSPNSFASAEDVASIPILKTNIGTHFVATSTPSSTVYTKIFPSSTVRSSTTAAPVVSSTTHKVTREPHILNQQNDLVRQASTASSGSPNTIFNYQSTVKQPKPTAPSLPSSSVTIFQSISPTVPTTPFFVQPTGNAFDLETKPPQLELPEVLKKNGLYAMAKFLKQSGLDTILNETGPYTIFVPTDKAFRTLLVQLGGPEKAEEKFKDNPRLLSGVSVCLRHSRDFSR